MTTIRLSVELPEDLILEVMRRRKCGRTAAVKALRMAWMLEVELLEPCFDDHPCGDPNEICFQSGGSVVR